MARKSRQNKDTAINVAVPQSNLFRVGAYVRISAEDKKQKGNSLENQQAIIADYINGCTDLELVEVYIDNGLSGQSFNRPAFTQMMADMESGKINCCITKDLSRLGRNAIDTGYYIEKYFPTKGIRYIAINDGYDSSDPKDSGLIVNLKNMTNEYYALEIGRKIRQTKQMNIRKGKFVGRFAPYGFMKDKHDKHQLVLDSYAAPIVRRMFEMTVEGKSVSAIRDWLNISGILPPKHYYRTLGLATAKDVDGNHTQWSQTRIYEILKNPVYCGDMVQGKNHTYSYVQKKVSKENWIVVKDTHEGIVSREFFDKVQTLRRDFSQKNFTSRPENIFLRKIFCGHCGYSLKRRNYDKKRNVYQLYCNSRQIYSNDSCVPVSICENDLKAVLLELLNKQVEVLEAGVASTYKPQQSVEQTAYKSKLQQLQSEINKNSYFVKSLFESLMTSDISQDEYRELKAGYEAKNADLIVKEQSLRNKMIEAIAKKSSSTNAFMQLGSIRCIADITADSLDKLVEKILVYEDGNIEVQFKFTSDINCLSNEF